MIPDRVIHQQTNKKPFFKSVKKYVKFILIAVLIAVFTLAAFFIWSPQPISWLVRSFATDLPGTPPSDLAEIQAQTQVVRDITYPSEHNKNKLDLYLPQNTTEQLPVIILVHGGGFVTGDKSFNEYYGPVLASGGYAVLSMNYELAPEANLSVQTEQIGEVWSYMKELALQYPLDSSRVIFVGSSAGAYLAGQFTLAQTNDEYARLVGVSQLVPADTIKGVLLFSAPYDITALKDLDVPAPLKFMIKQLGWAILGDRGWIDNPKFDVLNLGNYITSDFPPTFITDGNTGSFEKQAEAFVAALQEKDVPVTSLFFDPAEEKTGHGYQYDLASPAGIRCREETMAFLKGLLGKHVSLR
ncbi:MAG TPA: alpha/beta hydrolase [Paenibacillus sp.]